MNDFTKEELNFMADGIVLIKTKCKMDNSIREKMEKLDEKLVSLINNYCEHEVVTADMKEHHAVCFLYENNEKYFTINGDSFAFGPHASLDMAHKIICLLAIGANHFDNEWINRIIFRLQELKQHE